MIKKIVSSNDKINIITSQNSFRKIIIFISDYKSIGFELDWLTVKLNKNKIKDLR